MVVNNVEKKENKNISFKVEITKEEFETALNKAYLKNKSSITVPGFRKGKAPRMVVEGMFGSDVFHEDAINELATASFELGVRQESLKTVGRPSLVDAKVNEDKTALLTFETAVYPTVTLGQYKGLEAERTEAVVTDEDVDKELDGVRKRNARIVTVDRPAADGDTAVLDFDGSIDGVPFEGGKGENHSLVLGSGQFVPGFEEQVVGMSTGESKDITIIFPEDYHKEFAGKTAVFHVALKELKQSILPELDDEFAKDVSEFDTLEDYKADIRKFLTVSKSSSSIQDFNEKLITLATENMTVEIPDAMVEERVDAMIQDFTQNLKSQGVTIDQYLGMMGVDAETFFSSARPAALQQVKNQLLLSKIAEVENFEVSDEDVEVEYESIAKEYAIDIERVKQSMEKDLVMQDIRTKMAAESIYSTGIAKAPEAKAKAPRKKADAAAAEPKDAGEDNQKAPAKTTKAKKETQTKKDTAAE